MKVNSDPSSILVLLHEPCLLHSLVLSTLQTTSEIPPTSWSVQNNKVSRSKLPRLEKSVHYFKTARSAVCHWAVLRFFCERECCRLVGSSRHRSSRERCEHDEQSQQHVLHGANFESSSLYNESVPCCFCFRVFVFSPFVVPSPRCGEPNKKATARPNTPEVPRDKLSAQSSCPGVRR